MVTRRIKLLVLVYVALGLVSCIEADDDPQIQEAVPYEVNEGEFMYAIDPVVAEDEYHHHEYPMEGEFQSAVPLDMEPPMIDEPVEEPPMIDEPVEEPPMIDEPVEEAPIMDSPAEEAPIMDDAIPVPAEENPAQEEGPPAETQEDVPAEVEAVAEEEAYPEETAPTDDYYPDEETTTRIKKKRRKTTTTTPPPSCDSLLQSVREDCFANIPPEYDEDSCEFHIKNDLCDWEFKCEEIITEAPTMPDPDQGDSESRSDEVDDENDSDDDDRESCETNRKIRFKNCFINIKGLIQKHKALSCEKH